MVCALSALMITGGSDAGAQQEKPQPMPKPQAQSQSGGASTGGVFAPVLDEKHRPITAGGFIEGAPVIFEDVTKKSGLDKFKHVSGSLEKNLILEAPGRVWRFSTTTTTAGRTFTS
jgi:enediyne biosynthesis protein E4